MDILGKWHKQHFIIALVLMTQKKKRQKRSNYFQLFNQFYTKICVTADSDSIAVLSQQLKSILPTQLFSFGQISGNKLRHVWMNTWMTSPILHPEYNVGCVKSWGTTAASREARTFQTSLGDCPQHRLILILFIHEVYPHHTKITLEALNSHPHFWRTERLQQLLSVWL